MANNSNNNSQAARHKFQSQAHYGNQPESSGLQSRNSNNAFHMEQDNDDDNDEDSSSASVDHIRRNYLSQLPHSHINMAGQEAAAAAANPPPIQVQLNEGYLAKERRQLHSLMVNAKSRLASMQLFNPVKNQSMREQSEREWDDKEKYTLDCLNEARIGGAVDKFQWRGPLDGRQVWASKSQYFLAITSYSIGLGNVIRFPTLVQKNGGLAFIILFVIMLILEELAIGQRMRKAAISCWNLVSPLAWGIGLASAFVSFLVGLYYNVMVAWTLLYLFQSAKSSFLKTPLPFALCSSGVTVAKSSPEANTTNSGGDQCQADASPFENYWFQETLKASSDVNTGWLNLNWPVLLCLAIAWLISYLCLVKGLSSSKRMIYFASTFPYVILLVFLFKATSLPGSSDGIYRLFAPQAAAQVFFSLGLGFGGLIALSSYNPINNNCYKDAVRVSLVNFLTSILAGVVIFSILGYKATLSHKNCQMARDQAINFYLSDYNMKVLNYGSVFFPESAPNQTETSNNNRTSNATDSAPADYYDSEDAIMAIKTLDDQLASAGLAESGDSDVEYRINLRNLISKSDLEKVISQIPNLPECSIDKELDEASQGTGLVFVAMTEAISYLQDAPIWATIFFLMLFTLGLDSQFGNLEGLLSSVSDLPLTNPISRQWFTGFICCLSLVISVFLFANGAGSYIYSIFDEYAGSFSLVIIALFELVAISYIYGLKRFCEDCELMTGERPHIIILLSWRYISPIILLIIVFTTLREFTLASGYQAWTGAELVNKIWPEWCIIFGALLILACVVWIPVIAMTRILKIKLLREENLNHCWFPIDELREFYDIQEEHKVTRVERLLLGFQEDD